MAMLITRLCFVLTLFSCAAAGGDEPAMDELRWIETEIRKINQDPADSAADEVRGSEAIFHGFVFLRGRYLPPPYLLRWDGTTMTVNGIVVPIAVSDGAVGSRLLARFEQRLRDNAMLISVDGEPAKILDSNWALKILETLLRNVSWPVKCNALVQLGCEDLHSGQWTALVERFRSSSHLVERVEALRDAHLSTQVRKHSARVSTGTQAVFALALSMFSFATLVSYRPRLARWWEANPTGRAQRFVIRSAALLAALTIFDMLSSVWAPSPDTDLEVDMFGIPLAVNPHFVVAFKAALSSAGAGMLVHWRQYRFAQLTAWSVCLACTVVVVRWLALNSQLLPHF